MLNITNVNINYSGVGLASKDSSLIIGEKIKFSNSILTDLLAINKKSFYKGGKMDLKNMNIDSKITSMVQLGSEAIVNGNKLESYIIDTEKLYESIMMR